ncbi:MAG TPA: NADP-dependent oxidoreductase [Streptosporangiaceae bacterium]|nr:NADP-dependent oxidoreductase [Streptosporangiaceae bacterium]
MVVATAFGGPEVLSVVDQPVPEPGPGQARIEVRAAGVNPVDWKVYSGRMGADPARLPMRLGSEAAGVVTAVGPGPAGTAVAGPAGPVRVGDEVIAFRAPGAYAAALIAPADALVPKPAALDWAQASALMLTGVTAWHALAATGVRRGDTVLMHGAAGGVGIMAVQLAVSRGATVIATASPPRHDFLRGLGAIAVAYGDGLAGRVRAAAPGGVAVALDLIGTGEALDVSLALVPDRSRIATIVVTPRARETGIKLLGGAPGADPGTVIRSAARLDLARLAGDGALHVFVTRTYPLSQVAAAHRMSMAGHATGKIALIP